MAERPRILIAGASGVFGRLLAGELLETTEADLLLAGRDPGRLSATCRVLAAGNRIEPLVLDLRDPSALAAAAEGCFAVTCAAGPFQSLPRELPAAAIGAGAHWLDIADDRGWMLGLLEDRALDRQATEAELTVMPGASTVPALSGALVRWCCQRVPAATDARITLFLGNRNEKGVAALASALSTGFSDPRPVRLPGGRRLASRFESLDTVLLRAELGLETEFRVAFELALVNRLIGILSSFTPCLAPDVRQRIGRVLSRAAAPLSRFGSGQGCLQAELWSRDGRSIRAAMVGRQRLAILPCALALQALLSGELHRRGLVHPATWLEPDEWVRRMTMRGVRWVEFRADPLNTSTG